MAQHDPFDILGQQEKQEQQAERAKHRERSEAEDIKWLMSNRRGRRIAYSILEKSGIWRLSFSTNALQMAFNEGNRNEGLRLLAIVTTHCPETYSLMLKEHKEDE